MYSPVVDSLMGKGDVLVSTVAGCPVCFERRQLEAWPHTEIVLDVERGYACGFSPAAGDGWHYDSRVSSCPSPSLLRPDGSDDIEIGVDKNITVVFPAPQMSTIGELATSCGEKAKPRATPHSWTCRTRSRGCAR